MTNKSKLIRKDNWKVGWSSQLPKLQLKKKWYLKRNKVKARANMPTWILIHKLLIKSKAFNILKKVKDKKSIHNHSNNRIPLSQMTILI